MPLAVAWPVRLQGEAVAICPTRPRTRVRSPLRRQHFGGRAVMSVALCLLAVGCSEPLTRSRAETIIRHSKAFLSGAPESQPVFGRVSRLLASNEGGKPERREADSYIAEFSYHWRNGSAEGGGRPVEELTAAVVLRRSGGSWAVDDDRSRALVPSWPQLPRTLNPRWLGAPGIP
jgi:hypothetical protein